MTRMWSNYNKLLSIVIVDQDSNSNNSFGIDNLINHGRSSTGLFFVGFKKQTQQRLSFFCLAFMLTSLYPGKTT